MQAQSATHDGANRLRMRARGIETTLWNQNVIMAKIWCKPTILIMLWIWKWSIPVRLCHLVFFLSLDFFSLFYIYDSFFFYSIPLFFITFFFSFTTYFSTSSHGQFSIEHIFVGFNNFSLLILVHSHPSSLATEALPHWILSVCNVMCAFDLALVA